MSAKADLSPAGSDVEHKNARSASRFWQKVLHWGSSLPVNHDDTSTVNYWKRHRRWQYFAHWRRLGTETTRGSRGQGGNYDKG